MMTTEPVTNEPTTNGLAKTVEQLVPVGARVLDVGCGNGDLLYALKSSRSIRGQGLELSQAKVSTCIARGLSVVQGDAETDLADYPDASFDIVVLTQTIQAMRSPLIILRETSRIAERVIVSMPNFGHWRLRWELITTGRMPRSTALPSDWFETENIHLCTIRDFIDLCASNDFIIERAFAGLSGKPLTQFSPASPWLVNIRAQEGLFVLTIPDVHREQTGRSIAGE